MGEREPRGRGSPLHLRAGLQRGRRQEAQRDRGRRGRAVPFYTSEIEDTWYLHRIELTDAYEKAGVGGSPLDNDGMAAIYYYISEQVAEWYSDNAESIVEDARS